MKPIALLLGCLFTLFSPLKADRYVLVLPFDSSLTQEWCHSYPERPLSSLNGWQRADRILQEAGCTFKVTDLKEYTNVNVLPPILEQTDNILCCNLPTFIPDWRKKLARMPKEKLILFAYEPPSVLPEMYKKETLNLFGKVLTWNDALVDNKKFFKFNYNVMYPMIDNVVPFSKKKLLTQISGNKTSNHPDELYSARLRVIEFFEKKPGNDFDFYGTGWENLGYRNYKGKIQDKIDVLKNYKFSISYENIKNIEGYITEKIFDCFLAGVVPIYWGASNITDYIPQDCFIDRSKFKNNKQLVSYLRSISEKEYNDYLTNIRNYLASDSAQQFSQAAFADSIIKCLDVAR